MEKHLEQIIRACVGCGRVANGHGPWLRADDYEGVGVCETCGHLVGDWDTGLVDLDAVERAFKALGHDARDAATEASKAAKRITQRVLWFARSTSMRAGP